MFYYEVKKIFSKRNNKVALICIILLLGIVSYLAIHNVNYVDEKGETQTGLTAINKLKTVRKEWSGELTEQKIAKVIEENARINDTKEAKSDNVQMNNIAFSWKQGFNEIRDILALTYGKFKEYAYDKPDSLTSKDAPDFYQNRILNLREWLDTAAKNKYSQEEKAFLVQKYESLKTPMHYDYTEGWKQLFLYAPTLFMIMVLILGVMLSDMFSCEFHLKSDSIFYSTYHGRKKAVLAKLKAGVFMITVVYWSVVIIYSGIVLGIVGIDGANCEIQTGMGGFRSLYNITYWQEYAIIITSGYVGSLSILLVTMFVSAKTKSAVLAVIVPFILVFVPSFLSNINIPVIEKILGLLPDQLLQMKMVLTSLQLYHIGGRIAGGMEILLLLHTVLAVLLCPVIYKTYKGIEVK